MLDELIPTVEIIQSTGAMVLLKRHGERTKSKCTIMISQQDSGYMFREDSDDIAGALAKAVADYPVKHQF